VIDISVHQKGVAKSGTSGIQDETKSGCLRRRYQRQKQYQDGYQSPLLLLMQQLRPQAPQQSALELVPGCHCSSQHRSTEKEIVLSEVEMIPSKHSHTFDTGLRLPARDAGFTAALEVGFPPASGTAALEAGFPVVSVAAALEAGFTAALDGGFPECLEAGLAAA
jgi:hypothetical protein